MKIINILLILLGFLTILFIWIVYLTGINSNIIGFILIGFLFFFGCLCYYEKSKNEKINNFLNKKITWDIRIKK